MLPITVSTRPRVTSSRSGGLSSPPQLFTHYPLSSESASRPAPVPSVNPSSTTTSATSTLLNVSVNGSSSFDVTLPNNGSTEENVLTSSDQSTTANLTSHRSSSVAPASYTTTTTPWFTSAGDSCIVFSKLRSKTSFNNVQQ